MDNILDEVEQEQPEFYTDKELLLKVWTEPKKVFKYINDTKYDKHVLKLLVLAGISSSFGNAVERSWGDDLSLTAIIGICLIIGGLFGWISYYVYAALVSWTGNWLGGKGDTDSILRVIAYGIIPSLFALVLLIPQIALYGVDLFTAEGGNFEGELVDTEYVLLGTLVIEFLLALVSIVFCVIGVSEVQKLGIGKTIINMILPVILILISIFFLLGILT